VTRVLSANKQAIGTTFVAVTKQLRQEILYEEVRKLEALVFKDSRPRHLITQDFDLAL
jgi:hypothetical protein